MKIFILPLAFIAVIQLTQSATLRRKPKVYNALITTDQNLTPSRAFPVIQPHLQETYTYPSYSYRSYAPLGLYNNGFQYDPAAASSIAFYNRFQSYPRLNQVEGRNYFPRDEIHNTLPPIPLNYGLPPALVPINSFGFGNLAPYPYNSYPLIYDQFTGYGGGYLPPYAFYPPESDENNNADTGNKDDKDKDEEKDNKIPEASGGATTTSSKEDSSNGSSVESDTSSVRGGSSGDDSSRSSSSTNSLKSRDFKKPVLSQQQSLNENIKNLPNKDPSIPDVPPPPPSG